MEPIFMMQYAEFAVADFLSKRIKDASVFIPASAQEKGIDLLLYRFLNGCNTTNTIQVKMSRTYYWGSEAAYPYTLWFNRFAVPENANWFVLVGIYSKCPVDDTGKANRTDWDKIMLAFTNKEMRTFMNEVRQKKDPSKEDKMFGFGFDDNGRIVQTRGYAQQRDMSAYLIENRLDEIRNSFV